jgi:hypothetical protein
MCPGPGRQMGPEGGPGPCDAEDCWAASGAAHVGRRASCCPPAGGTGANNALNQLAYEATCSFAQAEPALRARASCCPRI